MILDLNQPVDEYCERTSAAFWAEPVNALSNIAFIIAGYLILKLYLRYRNDRNEKISRGFWILLLIGLVFIVGMGSFFFHTFATLWSLILDVVPIMVFGFIYIGVALKRILNLTYFKSGIFLGLFGVLFFNMDRILPHDSLNNSGTYLPYLVVVSVFAIILSYKKDPNAKSFSI